MFQRDSMVSSATENYLDFCINNGLMTPVKSREVEVRYLIV